MKFPLGFCLLLALAGAARAAAAIPGMDDAADRMAAGQPVRVVCFGDSITGIYYNAGGRRCWVDFLGQELRRIYPRAAIAMINAGISGNTTADALRRMETDVLDRNPSLVVVMFGINDVGKGVGPGAFRRNLETIIKRCRDHGAGVVLLTPNPIFPDDPARAPWRVAAYAQIVREVGRDAGVKVADAFTAFEKIRAVSELRWEEMMSDSLHPNLRGHCLFAEEAALAISGRRVPLDSLPDLEPGLPRVLARLRKHQPIRIVAMKPADAWVGPALRAIQPDADVTVVPWDPAGKSLDEIAEQAKGLGWWAIHLNRSLPQPDLVVLAVPLEASGLTEERFFHSYTTIVGWAHDFGASGWDCLAILPSVVHPDLDPAGRAAESLAAKVISGLDVPGVSRATDDTSSPANLLSRRLRQLLGPGL